LDRHLTAGGAYGGRIAHGLLGSTLIQGMISFDVPYIIGRGVPESYLLSFETNYRGAIFLDDTIKICWKIVELMDDPDQEGFGIVKTGVQVVNQDGQAVYDGNLTTKVRKRSGQGKRPQFKVGKPWQVKEFVLDPEKPYYLQDFIPEEGGTSSGRTYTEADIVNFCGLGGDYNPVYVDAEFAKQTVFGERIVPPMMVFTSAFGLWARDSDVLKAKNPGGPTEAGHLLDAATFLAPVKIRDTIRCLFKVGVTRVSKSKPDRGILPFLFQMINQRGEVVQEGQTLMMRKAKTGS
ncbi:MAG: MaoC/PaaZ C-terminal domain-containing protein, partial [Dehalococcoidia bacterium]|nr:MaoC/PaaZ C-terminal domain-containing protein [Dehalococcoidia bacterium]